MKDTGQQSPLGLMAAGVVTLVAACAIAQFAVQQPGGVGQINTQVNTGLYGGGVSGSVRYASLGNTSRPLDSEVRHAYWKSGALPSDVRMGYAALGPMAPGGAMAYIPPPGPKYLLTPSKAPTPPANVPSFAGGSIRYSAPSTITGSYSPAHVAPLPTSVSPAPLSSGPIGAGPINAGPINSGPLNAGPLNSGTVRYGW